MSVGHRNMVYIGHYDSPLGEITLASDGEAIVGLWLEGQKHFESGMAGCVCEEREELPVFVQTRSWLDLYFEGQEPDFMPPLRTQGTVFQEEVWKILRQIPYRKTVTYGEIAKKVAAERGGQLMSSQAVGGAVGRNPISILIPCHRVVGAKGNLTGYAGGVDKKAALLRLEKAGVGRYQESGVPPEEWWLMDDVFSVPKLRQSVEPYSKENFLEDVYLSEAQYQRLETLVQRKRNLILQGAPGVGKTFAAKRLAYALMGEKDDRRVEFVQFHQNYSYEDFVMGYRPSAEGFQLQRGIFYRFCQKAVRHPKQSYFFLIDEINRGNISKIFGELLMLLEVEYRGQPVTLAYNGERFCIPENVYLIGMMNTADRNLANLDYALRRRFAFFEMKPGFETEGFRRYQESLQSPLFEELIKRVQELNEQIAADVSLGRGFCIGHSYFCSAEAKSCTKEWMRDIVDYELLPLLREYWFDEEERVERWEAILHGVLE